MSFLDKMKAAAGVGSATVQVDVKQRPSKRGEALIAVARVVAGKVKQKMNYIVMDLLYEGKWIIVAADGRPLRIEGRAFILQVKPEESKNVSLEPGQSYEYPFQVTVPPDSPLTKDGVVYKFGVRADIEGVADPDFNTTIDING